VACVHLHFVWSVQVSVYLSLSPWRLSLGTVSTPGFQGRQVLPPSGTGYLVSVVAVLFHVVRRWFCFEPPRVAVQAQPGVVRVR
jgi:hypothetical protein